jgi:condensin-2 complex subunit H2
METRTSLVNNVGLDDLQRKVVRPPANLLETRTSLDSEARELDSYLVNFLSPLFQLQTWPIFTSTLK